MNTPLEQKTVYVAWTNTDLTEGKGKKIPLVVCESKTTALRLGKRKSVQGSNCHVTKETAVRLGQYWLAPTHIVYPSTEDKIIDKCRDSREQAIQKAKDAGLTDEDIKALIAQIGGLQ